MGSDRRRLQQAADRAERQPDENGEGVLCLPAGQAAVGLLPAKNARHQRSDSQVQALPHRLFAPSEDRPYIHLTLPMCPTVNHYYGQRGSRKFIKKAGMDYRAQVADIVAEMRLPTLAGRLAVFMAVSFASKRKQDLDNRLKASLDAMTHAGVWIDDSQIDHLQLIRMPPHRGGKIEVIIMEKPDGEREY